ncbi:hypothetical protein Taro_001330 [Colocasia esculenta]|uniref:Uncharacterized protein n=1 Tax=Colocasia esculenta TaxID=4460 RepID=A0A843TD96_COLES|nr:hypothetical protein [Colocasia esculenta]
MAPKQLPRRGAKSRASARPNPEDDVLPTERRTKRRHYPAEQPGSPSASPSLAKRGRASSSGPGRRSVYPRRKILDSSPEASEKSTSSSSSSESSQPSKRPPSKPLSAGKTILKPRAVDLDDSELVAAFPEVINFFKFQSWQSFISEFRIIYPRLVQEFYQNLECTDEGYKSKVKGIVIDMPTDIAATIFKIPDEGEDYHNFEFNLHEAYTIMTGLPADESDPKQTHEQPPVQEEQPPVQEEQPPAPEDQPQVHEDQPSINEDQPPVAAQVDEPFIAPHSPQLQPSSSMNLETEIPSFSPPPPVHASSSFGGPSVPPKLYTFLNDKFDALNTSIQSMSENFELRIQRLENYVSAKFIEQKAASDRATQRFNRLIGTLADASVDLKEHQEKLETVLQGILANSQADVFNIKETLSQISKTRLSFAHLVDDLESMKNLSAHIDEEMSALKREFKVLNRPGTNISCKGSVDTTINGVDTMTQSKGKNVKKRSSSVDTSPGQVDTRDRSQRNMLTGLHLRSTLNQIVDTRDLSQGFDLPVWESVSTHLMGRSTHSEISVT